jgi:membrane associated rhomboid family serine protease
VRLILFVVLYLFEVMKNNEFIGSEEENQALLGYVDPVTELVYEETEFVQLKIKNADDVQNLDFVKEEFIDPTVNDRKPFAFYGLLAVNVSIFVLQMYIADWKFQSIGQNPAFGPSLASLKGSGAKDTYLIQEGQIWRLFSPMFLHAGIIHLGMNMLALRNVALDLELEYGFFRLLCLYLVTGFCSTLTSAVFLPKQLGVGASGAIYGIAGALLSDLVHAWDYIENRREVLKSIIVSIFIGLLIGMLPLMDNFAHIGGLVSGVLLGYIILGHAHMDRPKTKIIRWICGVLLVAYICFMSISLAKGVEGEEWCPACSWMNCIPTPWWTCESPKCIGTFDNGTVIDLDWKHCRNLL